MSLYQQQRFAVSVCRDLEPLFFFQFISVNGMPTFLKIVVLVGLAVNSCVVVQGLALTKSRSEAEARQSQEIPTVEIPAIVSSDPKYRVDCSPDVDEHQSFCKLNLYKNRTLNASSESCADRGCTWNSGAGSDSPTCYIPIDKGGYELKQGPHPLSTAVNEYTLGRLSAKSSPLSLSAGDAGASRFSMFNRDINNLKVQVSVSGPDMIRMTIRNADAPRYEVPVPLQWTPSAPATSAPAKITFQMTKTESGQVGFRVVRTGTQALLFDTTFFANGFIYDDQFLQIITTIPSRNIYGKRC